MYTQPFRGKIFLFFPLCHQAWLSFDISFEALRQLQKAITYIICRFNSKKNSNRRKNWRNVKYWLAQILERYWSTSWEFQIAMGAPNRNYYLKKKLKSLSKFQKLWCQPYFFIACFLIGSAFKKTFMITHTSNRKLSRLCYIELIHRMKKVMRVFKPFLYLLARLHIFEKWIKMKLCYSLKSR